MMTDHCAARQQILLRCLTTAIQVAGLEGCYQGLIYDYLSHFSNCSYNWIKTFFLLTTCARCECNIWFIFILHISPHQSTHLRSHHLSLPRPFIPDLKLISFTNPFIHSLSCSTWTAFMDGPDLMGTGICFNFSSVFIVLDCALSCF